MLGAWTFRKRAESGPSLRNVWIDAGRDEHEPARRHASQLLAAGADPEGELAFEHVPGVRVLLVDVRVGADLARLVARPGDVDELVVALEDHVSLGAVGDRLALAGPEHERPHPR